MQSILDHNTIFLPIILDLKHNENSFQNLTRNMKSFKNVIEKEKRNNVFLSQTADMAVIEFNQTFFMKEKLVIFSIPDINCTDHLYYKIFLAGK